MDMTQNCSLSQHKGNFPGKSRNNKTTQICLKYSLRCAGASILEKYMKNNRLSPKTMVKKNLSLSLATYKLAYACINFIQPTPPPPPPPPSTTNPGHDLKGAKTLLLGQSLCTKILISEQNREWKAPPLRQSIYKFISIIIHSDTIWNEKLCNENFVVWKAFGSHQTQTIECIKAIRYMFSCILIIFWKKELETLQKYFELLLIILVSFL